MRARLRSWRHEALEPDNVRIVGIALLVDRIVHPWWFTGIIVAVIANLVVVAVIEEIAREIRR